MQRQRYAAILDAVLTRLRQQGYDSTRIADVALDSGAALATIYRYFGSRENLVFKAVHAWVQDTTRQALPADTAESLENRLEVMIRLSAERLIQEPELLKAWARVSLTDDPFITEHAPHDTLSSALLIYPDEVRASPELAEELSTMMGHVWFSGVVKWSLGRKVFSEVYSDVLVAMRVVLRSDRLRGASSE